MTGNEKQKTERFPRILKGISTLSWGNTEILSKEVAQSFSYFRKIAITSIKKTEQK